MYISQPERGLDKVVSLWKSAVHPAVPSAKLKVYCERHRAKAVLGESAQDLPQANVFLYDRCSHDVLLPELCSARALFYPGHWDETFCFAAVEAQALGVPVVTQGVGALRDRVHDGVDGFVCGNDRDFASALIRLMTDDLLFVGMSKNAMSRSQECRKEGVLDLWMRLLQRLL